ncbi:MAG: PD40 domain-containing protein [Candidatus Eremiobacteraeota bacterium]|nr:PD40 domain-containing protein [Candidatus Eremiobacteraeota bacterium]
MLRSGDYQHQRMRKLYLLAALAIVFVAAAAASVTHVGRLADGTIMTPIGQRLSPWGTRVDVAGRPNSLAVSPDGKVLAIANITSLDLLDLAMRGVTSYPYIGANGHTGTGEAPQGLTFSPDGSTIYVATQRTMLQRFDVKRRAWKSPFKFVGLPQARNEDELVGSLPAGLALSNDGRKLYVALNGANRVLALDASSGRTERIVRLGEAPIGVVRSGSVLAILNWGGAPPTSGQTTRLSGGTAQSVAVDPRSGIAAAGSLSIISLPNLKLQRTIVVGRHPFAGAFVNPGLLAVAEANDDSIALVDIKRGKIVGRSHIALGRGDRWGLQPQALALSRDRHLLFVALAGANAVAKYRITADNRLRFEGAFPTDWYPGALALLPRGSLAVANIKGIGSLASVSNDQPAGDDMPVCGTTDRNGPTQFSSAHDTHMFEGSIGIIGRATLDTVGPSSTARVRELSNPLDAESSNALPAIRHVFFIVRENRTYDQVFGDLPQGDGDSRFTNFPRAITPNAHALAEQYVLLDNFYSAGTQSGDGHQWLTQAATTDYIERSFPAWARSYPKSGDDPIAYAGSGFIWEDALRRGLTVRDYGEFALNKITPRTAGWADFWKARDASKGPARVYAHSEIPDLNPYVDHRFGGFDERIPDQARVDEFIRDLGEYERAGRVPNLILMSLGDDHTAGFDAGFPQPCSMIADNDVALGRIVDHISHSAIWKDSLILVTEDDSQDGFDHVDGHRQVALMIGPYVRRHSVNSHFYNQLSFIRTAEAVLGLPPINRFDAESQVMSDAFATRADLTPYELQPATVALDKMNVPATSLTGERRKLAEELAKLPPDVPDVGRPGLMRRALWLGER